MPISKTPSEQRNFHEARRTARPEARKTARPDIYNHKAQLPNQIDLLEKDTQISAADKQRILEYRDHMEANGLSTVRVVKRLYLIRNLARWLQKDFDKATRADLERVLQKLEKGDYSVKGVHSEWSKHDYKVELKGFYKWLRGGDAFPPEVAWIKTTIHNGHQKLPEDLPSEQDAQNMIKGCYNQRDRALIAFLFDSGARIGEALSLRIKDVEFDQYGAIVTLPRGKTGARRVRVVASSTHLHLWIKAHPLREDRNASLWVNLQKGWREVQAEEKTGRAQKETPRDRYTPMNYAGARKVLQEAARRGGVTKRVNPHNLRHSRATALAQQLTEAQMKEYLGWTQGSDMAAVYVHLSGRDVDKAILQANGVVSQEKPEEKPPPWRECPRCKLRNPSTGQFCGECSAPLDIRTMMEVEEGKKPAETALLTVDPAELEQRIRRRVDELVVKALQEKGVT